MGSVRLEGWGSCWMTTGRRQKRQEWQALESGGRAGPSPYAHTQRPAEFVCHLLPSWFLGSSWHPSDSSRLTSSPSQTPKLFPSSQVSSAPSNSEAVINTSLGTLLEVRKNKLSLPRKTREMKLVMGRKKVKQTTLTSCFYMSGL